MEIANPVALGVHRVGLTLCGATLLPSIDAVEVLVRS